MRKRRLVVGLTGTFGSGKTTATQAFKALGAETIDSDELVRAMYESRNPLVRKAEKLLNLKKFNRKSAAKIVFSNIKLRKALERMVHPFVFKSIQRKLAQWKSGLVVIEMPLLFETGFFKKTDTNILVTAPKASIQKRLEKKGFSKAEIKRRQAAQWSLKEKAKKADFIIQNNGNRKQLKEKVNMIFRQLDNDLKRRI